MGGLDAIKQLVTKMPDDLPVAIFIVQHTAEDAKPLLPFILSKLTSLKVKIAEDGEKIKAGTIYVSPSNQHLLVEEDKVTLGDGMMENRSRPSINNLFRSAAAAYHQKVIGILLTGLLYDGAKGLETIKNLGGTTIVQDPREAEYDEMPINAIKNAEIDYVASIEDMASLLKVLVNQEIVQKINKASRQVLKQIEIASQKESGRGNRDEQDDFRSKTMAVDDSLFSILQVMQERSIMLGNMAESEALKGNEKMAKIFYDRARECRLHTANLKKHIDQNLQQAS